MEMIQRHWLAGFERRKKKNKKEQLHEKDKETHYISRFSHPVILAICQSFITHNAERDKKMLASII